jgi:PAS domain S-box-containing protein
VLSELQKSARKQPDDDLRGRRRGARSPELSAVTPEPLSPAGSWSVTGPLHRVFQSVGGISNQSVANAIALVLVPGAAALGALAVVDPKLASVAAVIMASSLAAFCLTRLFASGSNGSGPQSSASGALPDADLERVEDRIWTLSEGEARFRETLDWQSEVILRRSADGTINFVNRAFCKMFGVDWDEVIGTQFSPPVLERQPRTEDAMPAERVLTVRGPRWIAWEEARIPNADQADDDVQLVGRDVTKQLKFERELAEARDAAEQANRAKSRFLAAMSHEIRTPMNGVIGLTRLLAQTDLDARQRTYVDGVLTSADYLRGLLNDVLDFSKIEAGQLVIERAPLALAAVIDDAVMLTRAKAEVKRLPVYIDADDRIETPVLGDALRLRQILVNLIDNAIKFTDTGHITVRANLEASARPRGADAETLLFRLTVDDTGRGFGDLEPETLFEEFEQALPRDSFSDNGLEGAGLGLSICRRLAVAMGGTIIAMHLPDGGARFALTVPLAAAPDETASAPLENADLKRLDVAVRSSLQMAANGTVLIVEDNPINAMVARASVERIGFASETVGSGEEAITRLTGKSSGQDDTNGEVFAVLLDLKLPGLSGFDVAQHLNWYWAEQASSRPTLIALTAHAFNEDRARCLSAGFDAHLPKPFDPDELEDLLCRAAAQYRTAAEDVP